MSLSNASINNNLINQTNHWTNASKAAKQHSCVNTITLNHFKTQSNNSKPMPIAHQRIRLINKPEASALEKLGKAHSTFGGPMSMAAGVFFGTIDPSGISSVGIGVVNDSINLYKAVKNRNMHKSWVSHIDPMILPPPNLDKSSLENAFINQVQTITFNSRSFYELKEKFSQQGMCIDDIKSESALIKKLKNRKFKNRLLQNFTKRQEAKASIIASKQRFDSNVAAFEAEGLTHEKAVAKAEKAETDRVVKGAANQTLAALVKKNHKAHLFFTNAAMISKAVLLSIATTTGLAAIAIKISALAGAITAPIAAITLPLQIIPFTTKVICSAVNFGATAFFRPKSTKEKLRLSGLKMGAHKLILKWHTTRYKRTLNKMHKVWGAKSAYERKLNAASNSHKQNQKIEKEINKRNLKIDALEKQAMALMAKAAKADNRTLDFKKKLIAAGWKDAQAVLKLAPMAAGQDYADQLAAWLFSEHTAAQLSDSTRTFFNDQMAIDVNQICKKFPGHETAAIAHHIKEYFAKDNGQMLDHIKSQRRKKRLAATP